MSIIRILLVDDDELVRTVLREALEHSGFAVTSASDVVEALKRISSERLGELGRAVDSVVANGMAAPSACIGFS